MIGNLLTIQPPSVSINSLGVWPTEEQDGLVTIDQQVIKQIHKEHYSSLSSCLKFSNICEKINKYDIRNN